MSKLLSALCAALLLLSQGASAKTLRLDARDLSSLGAGDASASIVLRLPTRQPIVTVDHQSGFRSEAKVEFAAGQLVMPIRLQVELSGISALTFFPMEFDLPREDAGITVTLLAAPVDQKADGVQSLRYLHNLEFNSVDEIQLQRHYQEALRLAEARLNRRAQIPTAYDLQSYYTLIRASNHMVERLNLIPPEQVSRAVSALTEAVRLKNRHLTTALPPLTEVGQTIALAQSAGFRRYKKLWAWIDKRPDCSERIELYKAYLKLYEDIATPSARFQIEEASEVTTDSVLSAQYECIAKLAKNDQLPAAVVNKLIDSHISSVFAVQATGAAVFGAASTIKALKELRR